jgi:hypothetical protein
MQKTKKQLQEEYTKELNEWITRCEKYSTEKDNLTESLADVKKIVSKQNDELLKLREEKKQMQKQMNEWCSTQVARLEAVKMLWSIMDSGGSHRQKRLFYHQAVIVLESEINELKRGVIVNSDDLPF